MAPQVPHTSTGLSEPEHSTPSCFRTKHQQRCNISDLQHDMMQKLRWPVFRFR
jgi:hypothetical protein